MSNQEDADRDDDLPVNRRDVLRTVGAAGAIGAFGTETVTAEHPKDFIVGTDHGRADIAERKANSVKQTIDFGPDIGEAVAGRWSEEALQGLRNNPHVRYVEEDHVGHGHTHVGELQYGVDRIDAEIAHDNGDTGNGIDVAVLDSGIDADHPDLQGNLGTGHSPTDCKDSFHPDGSCDEDWDGDHPHGTHVAGIVGAIANNSQVVGVAPDVTLHSVKVLDENNRGLFSTWCDGMNTAIDMATMFLI